MVYLSTVLDDVSRAFAVLAIDNTKIANNGYGLVVGGAAACLVFLHRQQRNRPLAATSGLLSNVDGRFERPRRFRRRIPAAQRKIPGLGQRRLHREMPPAPKSRHLRRSPAFGSRRRRSREYDVPSESIRTFSSQWASYVQGSADYGEAFLSAAAITPRLFCLTCAASASASFSA